MKRYLQKVDSDYNAFLAKMNASGSHPLTLAMGGGSDIFYGNGSGLRKAKFRSTADNSLGVSTLAPFSVFKVDGGENLAFETEITEMTVKMSADTVQDIDGMLTTTASVPYAMNIFQLVAKSDVEILPTDMILGLGYVGHAAVALSPMITVGDYINTWSSDVMYTEDDAFILDLTGLYVDCVNMMGNLTFIAYLARGNEDGSMQIIDIDLTYRCQLGERYEINVGPNDISLNADGTATFNMDVFSFPVGDYIIECDNDIPDDYQLIIAGYNMADTDSPNILFNSMIQDMIDAGLLNRNNLNKIFFNSFIIKMMMANYDINKVAFFIINEDGSIILSTRCSFDSINQEILAPYYFETEGEHEVEFEYVYKFMPELSFPRENSYFDNSCIIELNDNFYDYYNLETLQIFYDLEKIDLSNNVPEDIVERYISNLNLYSNLKEININTDKYITINNCIINKHKYELVTAIHKIELINIPTFITSINYEAFRWRSNLTSINIPNSVTLIGTSAFSNTGLISVTIPDSITTINSNAFYFCNQLKSVNILNLKPWLNINFVDGYSNPLCNDGDLYLDGQLVTDLVIPNGITSIKQYVFNHCKSLTSVEIPDSVTSIGKAAFQQCNNLTSINIPDSVTSIESHVFYGCSLLSVELPNTITIINTSLFNRCSNLTSVTIPDSVTSIGSYAFYNCSNLSEITCYAMTAPSLGSISVFSNVKTGGVLKVPTGATGYDAWMATSSDCLGYYNWSIEYI